MRYAVAIAAIGFVVLVASPTAALAGEPATIGVVDTQRVVQECKYTAEYEQRIKELAEQKEAEWNKRKEDFEKRVAEVRKEMLLLTEEAKAKKNAELAAEARELQDFERKVQLEIAGQRREHLEALEEKVKTIVEELAAEQGLDLVLNSAVVIYKKNVVDLTDAVLEKLNAMYDAEHAETEKGAEEGE